MYNKILVSKENNIYVFYQTDKNNQICDCSRIGRSLDILRGRPESIANAVKVMIDEFKVVREAEDNGENVISQISPQGIIQKYHTTVW